MRGLTLILDPERHTVVRTALDALVHEQWRSGHPDSTRPAVRDLARLRADAFVEMARRARSGGRAPVSGPRRSEPEVVVLIDLATIQHGELRPGGTCSLGDGTPISVEAARRLACEGAIIPLVLGGPSEPLDVGRTRRLATHAQRVAMRRRSPTCEFGVCDIPAERCRAHHLRPWEVGGSTDLDQLAWLCDAHHHLVHDGGWSMARTDGQVVIHRPDGTLLTPPVRVGVRDARAA
jgi:hypothetical protein